MGRFIPIVFSIILVLGTGIFVVVEKEHRAKTHKIESVLDMMLLPQQPHCYALPKFLKHFNISAPILIDLSQKQYKGIAMHYGVNYATTLHPKKWQELGHFSTYVSDENGNIYLVPTPFISIKSNTFELQKSIYRLNTNSGNISPFITLDEVKPSSNNPYGFSAIAYDCEDYSLWVAAIDESDYQHEKGVIYHIDSKTKKVLQKIEGIDVLSLAIAYGKNGKYLLAGSAKNSNLYAFSIGQGMLSKVAVKLLQLPSENEHIRKIKIKSINQLELQSIPFGYSLISQTEDKYRTHYKAIWSKGNIGWKVRKIQ